MQHGPRGEVIAYGFITAGTCQQLANKKPVSPASRIRAFHQGSAKRTSLLVTVYAICKYTTDASVPQRRPPMSASQHPIAAIYAKELIQ